MKNFAFKKKLNTNDLRGLITHLKSYKGKWFCISIRIIKNLLNWIKFNENKLKIHIERIFLMKLLVIR